jgi:class 3 adenylate cyclase/tetratricopeptide (TPR) repeat protein
VRSCANCLVENPDAARFCNACGSPLDTASDAATRKLVTLLFCDLAGSTEMATALDVESLRRIMGLYYEEMRAAIERHGGAVEKFIGDAVMAVFGVPHVHEDDALRAARAAMDMGAAISRLNEDLQRDHGLSLTTRIGINTGEVVAGDLIANESFVTGTAVNLAARLEQAARPNEVLLGEDTYRLIRDAVTAQEVDPFQPKGFDGPIRAHRLLAVTPGVLGHARRFDSPIVDRQPEQALLRQAFDRVESGRRCQLFTILGGPGIGKSRLVEEFLAYTGERAASLRGRCLPYGEGITFWPVLQVVEQAAGLTNADDRATAERKIASLLQDVDRGALVAQRVGQAVGLSRGVPAPEAEGASAGGTPSPDETLWAIRRFLEALSGPRPLVLVFDDIHWAEPTFLELIEHVADRSRDAPIMLLSLARPELLDASPNWGGGKLNATTMLLDPLRTEDAEALLRNLLGQADLAPELRSRILEMAGGYPLFVEEIVAGLIEGGLIARSGDRWHATGDVSMLSLPATISGLLAARLDRLADGERSVIERAALVGTDFYALEVKALTKQQDRDAVPSHLMALARKELIRPAPSQRPGEDAFTFRHGLIRDAAYDGMAKSRRANLHERYAEWLESDAGRRLEEDTEIVAYHLDRARGYLLELGSASEHTDSLGARAGVRFAAAGRRASALGDMPATVKLLGRAAALMPPDDPARVSMLPSLADGLVQSGDIARAESLLDEMAESARRIGDEVLETRAILERYTWQVVTEPAATTGAGLQAVAQRALRVCEEHGDDENLAAALEALAMVHRLVTGDIAAMVEAAERALGLARRSESRAVAIFTAANLAQALVLGATPAEVALARLEELIVSFGGEPMAEAAIGLERALILAMLDRFPEADRAVQDSAAVFEELGQRRWGADASRARGVLAWWRGAPEAAEPLIRSAFDAFRERGEAADASLAGLELALVLCELGELDEARSLAQSTARPTPAYALEPQIQWRRVMAKVELGREAIGDAERLVREAEALAGTTHFLTLHANVLMDLAEILHDAGRTSEASAAARSSLERSERKGDRVNTRRAQVYLSGGR